MVLASSRVAVRRRTDENNDRNAHHAPKPNFTGRHSVLSGVWNLGSQQPTGCLADSQTSTHRPGPRLRLRLDSALGPRYDDAGSCGEISPKASGVDHSVVWGALLRRRFSILKPDWLSDRRTFETFPENFWSNPSQMIKRFRTQGPLPPLRSFRGPWARLTSGRSGHDRR